VIVIAPKLIAFLSIIIDAYAITLWPFILTTGPLSAQGENHERIHLAQQRELLIVGFYFLYVLDYVLGRSMGLSPEEAYMEIRFEKEAYAAQNDLGYLERRQFWAWIDY